MPAKSSHRAKSTRPSRAPKRASRSSKRATPTRARRAPSARTARPARVTHVRPHGRARASAAADVSAASGPPDHFIVLVPGFMGSRLRDKNTGELVWIDFSQAGLNPLKWDAWLERVTSTMHYPNDNLEPDGIVQDVLFAPPWVKQEQYSRLFRTLESWGYRVDPAKFPEEQLDVYQFAYDWRQDNRISGRQLGAAVERWRAMHPGAQVWLMGHSNGGIISRWYIEKEGGKDIVSRLILLASPWDGAPKSVHMLFQGMDVLFRRQFNLLGLPRRTRDALRTFPSAYQLIPQSKPFLQSDAGEVDPFGEGWLDDPHQRELLADGRRFNQELGNHLSVDTVAFFGRKLLTTSGGRVHIGPASRWQQIDWEDTETGDGTLPEYTAVFKDTDRNIPVIAGHGDIYVNPALYQILRWELLDKYSGAGAGRVETLAGGYHITFETDADVYAPGAPIHLTAGVQRASGSAVASARLSVRLRWLDSLPGAPKTRRPRTRPAVQFDKVKDRRGEWQATLTAPAAEGYYQLELGVHLPSGDTVPITEMIAVEAEATPA